MEKRLGLGIHLFMVVVFAGVVVVTVKTALSESQNLATPETEINVL